MNDEPNHDDVVDQNSSNPTDLPTQPGEQATPMRRNLLKGIIAGAVGAVAGGVLIGGQSDHVSADPGGGDSSQPTLLPGTTDREPQAVTPGIFYQMIPGYTFQPVNSSQVHGFSGFYGAISQTGGGLEYFYSPIFLPNGVQLIECTFYVVNNDANPSNCVLNYSVPATGGGGPIGSKGSTANIAAIQAVNLTFSPQTIDYSNNAYFCGWRPGTASTTHRLYGARIGYRYAAAVPLASRSAPSAW